MIAWLESIPTFDAGLVVVGGFVISTMLLGLLVHKFTSKEIRDANTDRAGFILAVIGVVYAVLLAFVAIGVWERFQEAEVRTYDEAGALATVYRDSLSFGQSERLRTVLKAYARSVIDDEWPQMRRGEKSKYADVLLETAHGDVRALNPNAPNLVNIHAQMLAAMDTALRDRETRLTVDFIGINEVMWIVLVLGAYVTVAFTFLFGFERTAMQQLMIGGLALVIGLVMFLVVTLDYPYRGSIAVQPEAFRSLLDSLNAL